MSQIKRDPTYRPGNQELQLRNKFQMREVSMVCAIFCTYYAQLK